jgi:hypothetical protein
MILYGLHVMGLFCHSLFNLFSADNYMNLSIWQLIIFRLSFWLRGQDNWAQKTIIVLIIALKDKLGLR